MVWIFFPLYLRYKCYINRSFRMLKKEVDSISCWFDIMLSSHRGHHDQELVSAIFEKISLYRVGDHNRRPPSSVLESMETQRWKRLRGNNSRVVFRDIIIILYQSNSFYLVKEAFYVALLSSLVVVPIISTGALDRMLSRNPSVSLLITAELDWFVCPFDVSALLQKIDNVLLEWIFSLDSNYHHSGEAVIYPVG